LPVIPYDSSMVTLTEPRKVSADQLLSLAEIRRCFPALERESNGRAVAYFDGPGGTQVPRQVVEAMTDYLYHHNANTHWNYPSSQETDAAIASAREAVADFLNASPREIAFGNNMTTITFHVARALGRNWGPGDEVVVTELDHQANVAPWRALAKERGITIRSIPFDRKGGELVWEEMERAITTSTRLVAIGAASNALGTISPVREAAYLARAKGALCFVDAVHYAAHQSIDVKSLGCDLLVCSPYKFYGPHTGVLYARDEVMRTMDVPKLDPAPDEIPERMETGTQNHEGMVGTGAAVEFLAGLSAGATRRDRLVAAMAGLHARGEALFTRLWDGLSSITAVRCFGPPPGRRRTPTLSFVVSGVPSAEVALALADDGLFVSNGNFYASGVLKALGQQGMVRAGCACYTTEQEIERLIDAVQRVAQAKARP
jgi:cysteine desulfurase family protein (TIGR01976 family)